LRISKSAREQGIVVHGIVVQDIVVEDIVVQDAVGAGHAEHQ
jgi:hypothetical protein